jgi:glutathione reductase (NADPH)
VSNHDGKVVAANILEGNRDKPDYRGVPSVAFRYSARRVAESVYGHKMLVDEEGGRVPGAHLAGPHADEVINLFALAIRHDLAVDDLNSTMFAYPAGASEIGDMF